MNINGMPVFETLAAVEPDGPVKVHRKSKGSASYHNRIQKKWIKRFGWAYKPCIFKTPQGLHIHPALIPELTKVLEEDLKNEITRMV